MLSRFWYFLVAALGGAGIFAAFAAQQQINRNHEVHLADQLVRDRTELELWLRYDARARLDAIAPVAARADVRTKLRQASGRRDRSAVDTDLSASLGRALQQLNNQLEESAADLLFAVDKGGEIIGQLGGSAPPAGAGLGEFPLVQRALEGFSGDDVWIYNDVVYRVVARPVIDGGQYVGAVIHCSEVDEDLAQRLASRIGGASLGFFMRERMIGSHAAQVTNAPGSSQMEAALATVLEAMEESGRSDVISLGDHAKGVVALVTGTARHANVGYVIGRPARTLESPMALFTKEAVSAVSWPLVVGLPLLLGLLGLLFVFLERDRPFRKFRVAVTELGEGRAQRLDETQLAGGFRDLAGLINQGLNAAAAAGGGAPRKSADLDAILGDGGEGGPSFFGFKGHSEPPLPTGPSSGTSPLGGPAAEKKPPLGTVAAAPPPPAPVPGAPPSVQMKLPPLPPKQGAPPQPNPFDEDEGESATMVAQVPEELLAAASENFEEAKHFKEVYQKFVALKEECGEPTSGLSFEKFEQTLKKNRKTIVQKHGAKGVRFTVYKKNGKAALKATPVKA